jgi:hypothetical protein
MNPQTREESTYNIHTVEDKEQGQDKCCQLQVNTTRLHTEIFFLISAALGHELGHF